MEKYKRLRAFAQKDTALSHLLHFLFHLMRHWLSQVSISVIGTVIIALFIGAQRFDAWFYVSCFIYIALLAGTSFCKGYDKSVLDAAKNEIQTHAEELTSKTNEIAMLQETLMSMTTVMSIGSKHMYRVARSIKHNGWGKRLEDYREQYSFQIEAIAICREVYNIIQQHFGITNQWVTIYQRFENDKCDYCKMIGYCNHGYHEPSSYQKEYKLRLDKNKNVELHTKMLAKSESSTVILLNSQEVQKQFKYHKESEERERKIQQYIGIADTVCNRDATILLQIDTSTENGFGKTKDEISLFIETYIMPYMVLLKMHYENNRLFEMCYNHAASNIANRYYREEEPDDDED